MSDPATSIECKNKSGPALVLGIALFLAAGIISTQATAHRRGLAYNSGWAWTVFALCIALIVWRTWPVMQDVVLSKDGVLLRRGAFGLWSRTRLLDWNVVDELRILEFSVPPVVPLTVTGLPHRKFLQVIVAGKMQAQVGWWRSDGQLTEFLHHLEVGLTAESDWKYSGLRSQRVKTWRRANGL